jgi:hypothetical protein
MNNLLEMWIRELGFSACWAKDQLKTGEYVVVLQGRRDQNYALYYTATTLRAQLLKNNQVLPLGSGPLNYVMWVTIRRAIEREEQ